MLLAPLHQSPSEQMIASYLVWSERLGNPGLKQNTLLFDDDPKKITASSRFKYVSLFKIGFG